MLYKIQKATNVPWWGNRPWTRRWRQGRLAGWCSCSRGCSAQHPRRTHPGNKPGAKPQRGWTRRRPEKEKYKNFMDKKNAFKFLQWKCSAHQDLASSSLTRDELPCPVFCLKVKIRKYWKYHNQYFRKISAPLPSFLPKSQNNKISQWILKRNIRKYLDEYCSKYYNQYFRKISAPLQFFLPASPNI